MTISDLMLSDGVWHNITLHSQNGGLGLIIDNNKVGEELDSAGVHDFLDPYLTTLSVGGANKASFYSSDSMPPGQENVLV